MVAGSYRLLSTTKMKLQFAEMSTGGMQGGEASAVDIMCVLCLKRKYRCPCGKAHTLASIITDYDTLHGYFVPDTQVREVLETSTNSNKFIAYLACGLKVVYLQFVLL